MINVAISTCPNDVFIFSPLMLKKLKTSLEFNFTLTDIEVLNTMAIQNTADIIKISFPVMSKIVDSYKLLPSGGAMGYGVGPLLLSREGMDVKEVKSIAIPGFNTSAFRALKLTLPHIYNNIKDNVVELKFYEIMDAVKNHDVDLGIVIHEGRFIYNEYSLFKVADIGEEWQKKYSTPIPLGGIALKKSLSHIAKEMNNLILESIDYAYNNKNDIMEHVVKYADSMDMSVMDKHINLYVNDFTKNMLLGENGIEDLIGLKDIFHKI